MYKGFSLEKGELAPLYDGKSDIEKRPTEKSGWVIDTYRMLKDYDNNSVEKLRVLDDDYEKKSNEERITLYFRLMALDVVYYQIKGWKGIINQKKNKEQFKYREIHFPNLWGRVDDALDGQIRHLADDMAPKMHWDMFQKTYECITHKKNANNSETVLKRETKRRRTRRCKCREPTRRDGIQCKVT